MEGGERYRIVRRLGSGGSAELFEALAAGPLGFQRKVAIKKLRADNLDDDSFLHAFLDEAHLGARLHHANIVAVLDFGEMDGAPFQVLELVEGIDAQALLDRCKETRTKLPIPLALYITVQIAHALSHVHNVSGSDGHPLELVHRDVKPSNVLLSWSGDVKLGDFGIARARERLGRTVGGFTRGTLAYMSPEQMLGGHMDERTDLFSLGCLLHALLLGASPLEDDDARKVLLRDGKLVLAPELTDDVVPLFWKSLARDPEKRFDTAKEMAAATGRVLGRRIQEDPRTMLVSFLGSLRPPLRPRGPVAEMFDLELMLGGDHGVRRFASVAGIREETGITDVRTSPGDSEPPELTHTPLLPTNPLLVRVSAPVSAPVPRSSERSRNLLLAAGALLLFSASTVVFTLLWPMLVPSSKSATIAPPTPPAPVKAPPPPISVEERATTEVPAPEPPASDERTPRPRRRITPRAQVPGVERDKLERHLDQAAERLERLSTSAPPDVYRNLEDSYLRLAAEEAKRSDPTARVSLEAEAAALLRRIEALERSPP